MNFARLTGLCDTGMHALVCDLSGIQPSAATVDALARLALALRRQGSRLRLRHASPELVELIELMGLAEVLRVEAGG
jgi:anti-anti-sigma regulatory factor